MRTQIPDSVRERVRARAGDRCEYCQVASAVVFVPHEVDHVVAVQHGGAADFENLALCCLRCNRRKGPNLASIDPSTGEVVRLFHPRVDAWGEHFALEGTLVLPLTAVGRATERLLELNDELRRITRGLSRVV